CGGGSVQACLRGPVGVPTGAEGGNRVGGPAEILAHLRAEWSDVRVVGIDQDPVRGEDVAVGLRALERRTVDEKRLRVRLLQVQDGLEHRLDPRLDVVRLVDREPDAALESADVDELEEDPKELEAVDRADDQVVVAILAVVDVKAAEPTGGVQARDDQLDV